MKRWIPVLSVALLLGLLCTLPVWSGSDKIRVGVLRFTNQTSAGWWSSSVGDELSDMLAAELVENGSFSVLERKELDAVLGEREADRAGTRAKPVLCQACGHRASSIATRRLYLRPRPIRRHQCQNRSYGAVANSANAPAVVPEGE